MLKYPKRNPRTTHFLEATNLINYLTQGITFLLYVKPQLLGQPQC